MPGVLVAIRRVGSLERSVGLEELLERRRAIAPTSQLRNGLFTTASENRGSHVGSKQGSPCRVPGWIASWCGEIETEERQYRFMSPARCSG
jgi:hypothetical protein